MTTRGKKTAAELSVVQGFRERPEPPPELTLAQAEEWRAVVERMPFDWFPREIQPLLCAYCRHVCNARHVARLIEAAGDMDIGDRTGLLRLNRLLSMQHRQSNALVSLATRMRLTMQSRYTATSAATAATRRGGTARKLWKV